MGSGSSSCPKCGTTYDGAGGGPKTAAAAGQPAAVPPAALDSPEAALAALKEMVGSGQCKVAEAPKATDPYRTAVAGLAAATNAAQKAANQLNHHRLLQRQAEEKLANLGIKVEQCMAECSAFDGEVAKARVAYDELDAKLKAGPAVGPAAQQHGEDVSMADGDRFAKLEARLSEAFAENKILLERLNKMARVAQPTAAAGAAVVAAAPPPAGGEQRLAQQPAATVFEPGWAASSAAAAAAGSTLAVAASGTKRGASTYRSMSNGSGYSRSSRRERFFGTGFARGRPAAAVDADVDGEEVVRRANEVRENVRLAMAGDLEAARAQSLG